MLCAISKAGAARWAGDASAWLIRDEHARDSVPQRLRARTRAGRVLVVTSDGRCYVGMLRACDQATNLVLADAEERVYSTDVRAPLAWQPPLAHAVLRRCIECFG